MGKRKKPTLLAEYEKEIDVYWKEKTVDYESISKVSREILTQLRESGYQGGERTIRNYLYKQPYVLAYLQEGNEHD